MDWSQMNSISPIGSSAKAVSSSMASGKTAAPKAASSTPPASSSSSSNPADSSDITAQDFLTLLVSELQNQDPTQPTDPNQYITQLTQVNSLQQLIQLNQTTQLGDGDSVALLNDIDLTVNPSSTVASPSTPPTSGSGSGS